MSNNDHLRPVSSPPALASATTRRLLPSPSSGQLFVSLPNEWCRQALHVRQLLGGASQLQSTFAYRFCDPDGSGFSLELFELRVDAGQVVIQFAIVCDIHSDAPVIKSVGCFGEVSVNSGGTDQKLVEPGGKGVDWLGREDRSSVDGEQVGHVQRSLFLAVCLDVPVMSWGNPVSFGIDSFSLRDLEVGVHGIADVAVRRSFIGFSIPFNGRLESFDLVLEGQDHEAVDFFAVLDGLDQTGCDLAEGGWVDINVGGEYVFHSTRGIAGRG